jgi:hypothetical protein
MSTLADRIRAAREQWVTAEGKQFLLRRPTRLQLADLNGQPREVVFSSVVGWKLTELDLVPGGSGRVPEFDPEAFREYASDRIDLVNSLAQELQRMISAHSEAMEAAEKN